MLKVDGPHKRKHYQDEMISSWSKVQIANFQRKLTGLVPALLPYLLGTVAIFVMLL